MSIQSMCDRFTATLERQGSSRAADGSKVISFSTANRTSGGLPSSVRSDFQTMTSDELVEYGIRSSDISWCMYSASDPKLDTRDRVVWVDNSSIQRTCRVASPSFDMAGRSSIWKTILTEELNRK